MAETVHFSTLLRPHRSLSPLGFKWLIRLVIAANLLIGLPMYLLGAWPVAGFAGLDVALLWWLFNRNYVDARRSEAWCRGSDRDKRERDESSHRQSVLPT